MLARSRTRRPGRVSGRRLLLPLLALPLLSASSVASVPERPGWFEVRFERRITDAVRGPLASGGLAIADFLPPRSYVVWGSGGDARRAATLPGIGSVLALDGARKIAPSLGHEGDAAERVTVTVARERANDAVAFLETVGEVLGSLEEDELRSHVVVVVPLRDIPSIAARPEVRWVAPAPGSPIPLDEASDQVVAGNVDHAGIGVPGYRSWLAEQGLDGSGVRVSVIDSGVDDAHPDLAGRVIEHISYTTIPSSDRQMHGTHVAGIVGGDPALAAQPADAAGRLYGLGMAPGVEILDQQFLGSSIRVEPFDRRVLAQDAWRRGVRIANNSWTTATDVRPGYDELARTFDLATRDADPEVPGGEEILFVFAAGNDPTFVSTPQEAKNILPVGSTRSGRGLLAKEASDPETLAPSSSRGPAVDGRIFPLVVAPGDNVVSTRATAGGDPCTPPPDGAGLYVKCSGTSMASPHAAGAAALLHEWWQRERGAVPSPAMVKALLVSSAKDIGLPDIPNTDEGWGRIHLRPVLEEPPSVAVDQGIVFGGAGERETFEVQVGEGASPLKVTLSWSDAAGTPGAAKALVNDLDLVVEQLAADERVLRTWWGNAFVRGASVSGGEPDRLNNLENVFLETPAPGRYRITVAAHDLPGDGVPGAPDPTDQDFALVVRGGAASDDPEAQTSIELDPPVAQGQQVSLGGRLTLGADATEPIVVASDAEDDVVATGAAMDIGTSTIQADLGGRTLTFRMGIADPPEAGAGAPFTGYAWPVQVDGDDDEGFWLGAGWAGTNFPPRSEPWTELCTADPTPGCGRPVAGAVDGDQVRWEVPFDALVPGIAPGSVVGPGGAFDGEQSGIVWSTVIAWGYPSDATTSFRGYRVPGGIDVAVTPEGVNPDPADFEPAGSYDAGTGAFEARVGLPPGAGPHVVWVRSCWGPVVEPRCVRTSSVLS